LTYLSKLNNLEFLTIPGNENVTDEGIKYLSNLKRLEYLRFNYCASTNNGLRYIEGLSSLRSLSLYGSKVTREGTVKLEKNIPGLTCYLWD